jgi:hypothetical protein
VPAVNADGPHNEMSCMNGILVGRREDFSLNCVHAVGKRPSARFFDSRVATQRKNFAKSLLRQIQIRETLPGIAPNAAVQRRAAKISRCWRGFS